MKYRSMRPLNSAPDAGVRVRYHRLSDDARKLLDELRVPHDATVQELRYALELKLQLLNVDQRKRLLERIGKIFRDLES